MKSEDQSPSDRAQHARTRAAAFERKRAEALAFAKSPAGLARAARRYGRKIFQIDLPLSQTTGYSFPLLGTFSVSGATANAAGVIEAIEAEGWALVDVGYVYRSKGSISRDKFLSSAELEAAHGEIIGIYLFRASGEDPPPILEPSEDGFVMDLTRDLSA